MERVVIVLIRVLVEVLGLWYEGWWVGVLLWEGYAIPSSAQLELKPDFMWIPRFQRLAPLRTGWHADLCTVLLMLVGC